MKSLIVLVVGLLSVGCATVKDICVQLGISKASSTEMFPEPDPPLPREIEIRDSMIGEYESIYNGFTFKYVFLANGIYEFYIDGKKEEAEHKWSISRGEIHVIRDSGSITVCRINKDKSITGIANIVDGKRTDYPKDGDTFKKIKELTPEQKQKALRDSVVGEYELKRGEDTLRMVLLGNGISEGYKNGKKDEVEHKWSISKEGELHVTYSNGNILVLRINKDGSITIIARIYADGKREEVPKDKQMTFKKIK